MANLLARQWVVILALAMALVIAAPAYSQPSETTAYDADSPSAAAMAFDAVVVRPLSLAATVVGTGLFIVSLPISALGGNVDQAGDRLVVDPAQYTFSRPLGDFNANSAPG